MKEIVECTVNEMLALAKNYGDLYKAASDLVESVETFQFTDMSDRVAAMEMLEVHIDKIATIIKEQRQ